MDEEQAIIISRKTISIIKERGWCLWRCENLNNDIILVLRDGFEYTEQVEKDIMDFVGQLPIVYPDENWINVNYTETELKHLAESDNIQFLHLAKKQTGGEILQQEGL